MQINAPKIKDIQEVSPGELFYLDTGGAQSLGIIGEQPNNARYAVWLEWAGKPSNRAELMDIGHLWGPALVIEDYVAEVVPSTIANENPAAIYSDSNELFLPAYSRQGLGGSLLNLFTGVFTHSRSPRWAGFHHWRIRHKDMPEDILWENKGRTDE